MSQFTFQDDDMRGLAAAEQDSVMEALLAAAIANQEASPDETRRFVDQVQAIEWDLEPTEVARRVEAARGRLQEPREPAAFVEFIKASAARIPGRRLREKVLRAMAVIMYSGSELSQEESGMLVLYGAIFGVPADRIEHIKADVRGAYRGSRAGA